MIETKVVGQELEIHEAAAWVDFYRGASAKVSRDCRLEHFEIAGAQGVIAAHADSLALNRVLGLGLAEPATEAMVDAIVDRYASAGVRRFFVQLHPAAEPSSLSSWLEARGFKHYNNWVKLFRGGGPVPAAESDLRVEVIDESQADTFASIVVGSFGWPGESEPWVAELVARPGWTHYLAFDGDLAVATGATFVRNRQAWLDFAATLSSHRRRGAQSLLLERRLRDALGQGCESLVLETAEELPERPSPSYRNARRFGFQVAYLRPSFLFEAA
jgi:GNAT superfamily N-acetyltransferase